MLALGVGVWVEWNESTIVTQKEDVLRQSDILRSPPQLILILMLFFIMKEEDSGSGGKMKGLQP